MSIDVIAQSERKLATARFVKIIPDTHDSSMDNTDEAGNDFEDILEQNYTKLIENEGFAKVKEDGSAARTRWTASDNKVETRGRKRKTPESPSTRGSKRLKSQEKTARSALESFISSELAKFNNADNSDVIGHLEEVAFKEEVVDTGVDEVGNSEEIGNLEEVGAVEENSEEADNTEQTESSDTDSKKQRNFYAAYSCDYAQCYKTFRSQKALDDHIRVHTGEKPHECFECGKRFTQRVHLNQHIRTHTGERPYECKTCGKCFSKSGHLSRHRQIHLGYRPFKCDVCGKAFIEMAILKRHYMIHTGEKPFGCKNCDKAYNQLTSLKLHLRTAHPEMVPAEEKAKYPYQVKNSENFYSKMKDMREKNLPNKRPQRQKKKKTAQKKLLTRDDLEKFISSELSKLNADSRLEPDIDQDGEQLPEPVVQEVLLEEVVVNQGKKRGRPRKQDVVVNGGGPKKTKRKERSKHQYPHACEACGESFKFQSQLKRHEIKHSGDRPYACPDCYKAYSKSSHLKRHMQTHTGEKMHQCPECDKTFIELAMLKRHVMVHTGEKPYGCGPCGMRFNQLQSLHAHHRSMVNKNNLLHLGENAFMCGVCGNSFDEIKMLHQHYKSHSNNPHPYLCDICSERFRLETSWQQHMSLHEYCSYK